MPNPLMPELFALLMTAYQQGSRPLKIYELFEAVAEHELFLRLECDEGLLLFHKNFWIMNALYQLQDSFWEEHDLFLSISSLEIQLQAAQKREVNRNGLAESDAVRAYYLNWDNATGMTEAGVQKLLEDFWQYYQGARRDVERNHPDTSDPYDGALQTLGLKKGATRESIRRQYRRLASEHHPDKGGITERFIEIRSAYEWLMR